MSDRKKLLLVLCAVIGELVSESMLRLRFATADGCIRAFLTIRKAAISKNGVPYFKAVQICRKPEIIILRKTVLAKVGFPYFEDLRFSKKSSFLTIRIARFLKA